MEFQTTLNQNGSSACSSESALPARRSGTTTTLDSAVFVCAVAHFKSRGTRAQVFDVRNRLCEVFDARATKHGFDLLFGRPAMPRLGNRSAGGIGLIATPALAAYWEANRTKGGGIYDLPVGRASVKRVRRLLGFNLFKDRRALWRKRAADLKQPAATQPAQSEAAPLRHRRAPWTWLGEIHDLDGKLWDVRERRPSKYGFDLFFGYRADSGFDPYATVGNPRLIATPQLLKHLRTHRGNSAVCYDLPASYWTLRPLRIRFNSRPLDDL